MTDRSLDASTVGRPHILGANSPPLEVGKVNHIKSTNPKRPTAAADSTGRRNPTSAPINRILAWLIFSCHQRHFGMISCGYSVKFLPAKVPFDS